MTIFGESRLGRIGYIIIFVVLLGFDFVKQPVQLFIVHQQDLAEKMMMTPRPVTEKDRDAAKINGMEMPLMLKQHHDVVKSIAESPEKLSKAEIRERLRKAAAAPITDFTSNRPVDPEIARLVRWREILVLLEPAALLVMGGITIVGMLYMVSSRLRDIGWPQALLWVLLAPVFLPRFLHLPLPPLANQGVSLFFYTVLFILAFIPGEDQRGPTPSASATVPPRLAPRKGAPRFGRLGAN